MFNSIYEWQFVLKLTGVKDLRARAPAVGRDPTDLKILTSATPIVGRTTAEAREKRAEYLSYVSHGGALALLSAWLGIDMSRVGLDEAIGEVRTEAIQSALEQLARGTASDAGLCDNSPRRPASAAAARCS